MQAPALRPGPGQRVLLDNLPVHLSAQARRAIEAAGGTLQCLPIHSLDFHPIERVHAKLKAALRRAEFQPPVDVIAAISALRLEITLAGPHIFLCGATVIARRYAQTPPLHTFRSPPVH